MRYSLLWVCLCLVSFPIIITAQGNCTIELENSILHLVQAQRAADSGETLKATSILQSVQGDLDDITNGCDTIRLEEKYISPDETLAFSYPDGWTVRVLDRDVYLAMSTPSFIDIMDNDLPEEIPIGEAAIALQVQPIGDETFDETLEDIEDDLLREFSPIGRIQEENINGRRHVKLSVTLNENVSGRIGIIDFSDAEVPVAILVLGLANSDSLPLIEVYTDTLIKSLQYPPTDSLRESGVSADTLSYSDSVDVRGMLSSSSHMILSPDGTMIAYQDDGEICLHEIETTAEKCTPIPDNFRGRTPLLQWSPDGRFIIFQEDALRLLVDGDVWLYDVAEQAVTNLTDDGVDRVDIGGFEQETWMDTTTTWGVDNQIYLLRTAYNAGDKIADGTYELLRIDPDSRDITLIQDLTGYFDTFPIFHRQGYSLDGVMAVSPDASQMAVIVAERNNDSPNNGLWLIDLHGIKDPQQIASSNEFIAGYDPEIFAENGFRTLESIAWDANGTGLFVYAAEFETPTFLSMTYHITLGSGEIVPMVDLSSYSPSDFFNEETDDGIPIIALVMRYPVLAPDFSGIIGIAGPQPETLVTMIPFNGEPGKPTILYREEEVTFYGDSSTIASDGTMILLGRLFQPD